jgi:hypothetical protein
MKDKFDYLKCNNFIEIKDIIAETTAQNLRSMRAARNEKKQHQRQKLIKANRLPAGGLQELRLHTKHSQSLYLPCRSNTLSSMPF